LKTILHDPLSLEMPVGSEGDSALDDLIEDRSVGSPVDAIIEGGVRDETTWILKTLSAREESGCVSASAASASTRSKRSARSSMSRASGFGRSRPRHCDSSALSSGRGDCGP